MWRRCGQRCPLTKPADTSFPLGGEKMTVIPIVLWSSYGIYTDFRFRRLPNWWLLLGLGCLLVWGAVTYEANNLSARCALIGAATFGGSFLVAFSCAPRTLGAGDVKLAGLLGLAVGCVTDSALDAVTAVAVVAVLASVATLALALGSAAVASSSAIGWSRSYPHGPSMLAAAALVVAMQ